MKIVGRTEARLHTQPLRPLTPETSLGFEVIDFAKDVCGIELLPWQAWLLVRMLELNDDGSLRFSRVVVLVGRQNGKTTLLKILSLWIMLRSPGATVLGVAQDLSIAKESWAGACEVVEDYLPDTLAKIKRSTGDLELLLTNRSRYRIAAANGRSGRGLPVKMLVLDELREMKTWEPYQALAPTTTAQVDGLIVCISNAGESDSIVLNSLRDVALAGEEEGVALFEWSAPEGCELDDPEAWGYANPGLGYTVQESALRVALATFPPAQFRTEHLCQRVDVLNAAIDLGAWKSCSDPAAKLDLTTERPVLCVDVAPDNAHVSLVASVLREDGRVKVIPIDGWDSTEKARRALPALIEQINPTVVGYFGQGPGAALAVDMKAIRNSREIKTGDVASLCQSFAEQVTSQRIIHGNDPLLNAHVSHASKMRSGDGWKFCRTAGANVDALYAAAGAAHLARNASPSKGKPRIIVAA